MSELPDWLRDLQPLDDADVKPVKPSVTPAQPGAVPDWLQDLRPRPDDDLSTLGQSPSAKQSAADSPPPPPEPEPEPEPASLEEALLVDYQTALATEEAEEIKKVKAKAAKRARLRGGMDFLGLRPWQRFVLALLLYFNVTLIGLLLLAMGGKISP